jgi:hypothetical protein
MEIAEDKNPYVFQVDSEIVQNVYNTQDNYLISYNEECTNKDTCAIYFSSNDIYFPNTQEVFEKRIVEKDFYEWYGTRLTNVYKHILVRDVYKQWYLSGINNQIDTPEKLKAFLLEQTKSYKIYTLGSSAGGYAAALYGTLLKAEKAIVFNAQFEIGSLLKSSKITVDPLIFRYKNLTISKLYDIKPIIQNQIDIFYFYSLKSPWDMKQYNHIKGVDNVHVISFNTSHHGIPFLKTALSVVVNLDGNKLKKLAQKKQHPIYFTIRMIGVTKTFLGAKKQLIDKYRKKKLK